MITNAFYRLPVAAVFAGLFVAMVVTAASAQSSSWSVFRTCNTRPCTIGVAVSTWYQPGWSRIASYSSQAAAWQRACWLHFNDRGHNSPDIAAGRVNCNAYR